MDVQNITHNGDVNVTNVAKHADEENSGLLINLSDQSGNAEEGKPVMEGLESFGLKSTFVNINDPGDFKALKQFGFYDDLKKLGDDVKKVNESFNIYGSVNPLKEIAYLGPVMNVLQDHGPDTMHDLANTFVASVKYIALDFKTDTVVPNVVSPAFYHAVEEIARILTCDYHIPLYGFLDYKLGVKIILATDLPADESTNTFLKDFVKAVKLRFKADGLKICEDFQSRTQMIELPGTNAIGFKDGDLFNAGEIRFKVTGNNELVQQATLANFSNRIMQAFRHEYKKFVMSSTGQFDVSEWFKIRTRGLKPYINKATNTPFIDMDGIGGSQVCPFAMDSKEFFEHLLFEIKRDFNTKLTANQMNILAEEISGLVFQAKFEDCKEALHKRIAYINGEIYYDLADEDGNIIAIGPDKVRPLNKTMDEARSLHFVAETSMAPQVYPLNEAAKPLDELLAPFLNMDPMHQVLAIVTIVAWFIGNANPLIWLNGLQGSGKTCLTKIIQKIVDPISTNPPGLPTTVRDMAAVLGSRYVVVFDNLSKIKPAISDMLCMAVYGGTRESRKLYTDSTKAIVEFKNAVVLNSISEQLVDKPDLMQRVIMLKLKPLEGQRKTEEELMTLFGNLQPSILFKIFDTISKASAIMPSITPPQDSRLIDFARWGAAISKVLWNDEEVFLEALKSNKTESDLGVIETDPVTATVLQWLRDKETEETTKGKKLPLDLKPLRSSDFHKQIVELAASAEVNLRKEGLAPNPTALTKKLGHYTENFKNLGVEFNIKRNRDGMHISISIKKTLALPDHDMNNFFGKAA